MFPQQRYNPSLTKETSLAYGYGAPSSPATVFPSQTETVRQLDPSLLDEIEAFLMKIKRGRFVPKQDQSMSMVAAMQATKLLQQVVDFYGRNVSKQIEQHAREEVSRGNTQVNLQKKAYMRNLYERAQAVIQFVTLAGQNLQRATAFKAVLANATRRVLAIIRDALETATVQEKDFDADFRRMLRGMKREFSASADGDLEEDQDEAMEEVESGEDDDVPEEWAHWENRGSPLSPGDNGLGMPATPDTHSQDSGGLLLPRVNSTAADELRRAKALVKPINFTVFYDTICDGISALLDEEYPAMDSQVVAHAPTHVYNGEIVLVYGYSHTILAFLKAAASQKELLVCILEGAPRAGAATLASALADKGIATRILPDSSCFAVMSRFSKVFLGAEAILANGGLLAPIGTHMVCLAAQHHAVPVVVVAASLKLCPYHPSDGQCTGLVKISTKEAREAPWSTYSNPHELLPLEAWNLSTNETRNGLEVNNPTTEYVPPSLISLFIMDIGECAPEDINQLVREQYKEEDTNL
jgi:translation initiation factor 2B subunit (eIF-2B alpha/beta/delta family)